jgi:hypothetical protein
MLAERYDVAFSPIHPIEPLVERAGPPEAVAELSAPT